MQRRSWFLLNAVLVVLLTFSLLPKDALAARCTDVDCLAETGRTGWSAWSTHWNAVAAVDDDFWLAGSGVLMRWNPADGVVETITPRDGLPHVVLYNVIDDGAGGIWLSGDGGISRRDAAGQWRHIPTPEPPRADDGYLFAGAAGDLWLASATTDAVFHYDAGGTWRRFADARAAVEAEYAAIQAVLTRGKLWTVSHGEVWVGFDAYDGAQWHAHPAPDGTLADAAQDAAGNIYLHTSPKILMWDGSAWAPLTMDDYYSSNLWTLFAVTPDGVPWQVDLFSFTPSVATYTVRRLTPPTSFTVLGYPPTGTHLLAENDTLWLFGHGWIRAIPTAAPESATLYTIDEKTPPYQLRADPAGDISIAGTWPLAAYIYRSPLARWNNRWTGIADIDLLDEWEYAPDGALWYVQREALGPPYRQWPLPPRQRSGSDVIAYPAWPVTGVSAVWSMTVVNANVVLFGVDVDSQTSVLRLDNRGTPSDFGDDRWQRTDLPASARHGDVVEDGSGRIWMADDSGTLWRLNQSSWQEVAPIRAGEYQARLVPAADDVMYLAYDQTQAVLVVRPDGTVEEMTPDALMTAERARLLTARRANPRWAVAKDGAIWFTRTSPNGSGNELVQVRGETWTAIPLPAQIPLSRPLLADRAGSLWIDNTDAVWWYGPLPDFALDAGGDVRLLPPATTQIEGVRLMTFAGFTQTVNLTVSASPELNVALSPAQLAAGATTTLTLTTPSATGVYSFTLNAAAGPLMRSRSIEVIVTDDIRNAFLPLAR